MPSRRRSNRGHQLTKNPPPEPEPRRSVRATKGQHKLLDSLDQPIEAPKRRGGSKKNKKAAPEPEEPEEEIIRCVCGATEQDEDSGEPWIACDQCGAWQHNICMGMSQYTEDLPKEYFCELCRPENHTELLAGVELGEKPWEARRRAYEEEKAEKKKKGPKKGKKRTSDLKEDASQKSKQSPPPPPPLPEPKKDAKATGVKRKNGDGAQEKETKKMRKINDTQSVPIPGYTPPGDIPAKISELPDARQGPAKALFKALVSSIGVAEKNGAVPSDGTPTADRAERFALQIERAVHDAHPTTSSYASQIRTLAFNLKSNPELTTRLLARTLTPPMLASMSTEELASKELQKETAEMLARAEKQAIKITEDVPRVRRTHKGDEMVGDDHFIASEDVPSAPVRRPSAPKQEPTDAPEFPPHGSHRSSASGLAVDSQQSPTRTDFDLSKVFSSVKSPTLPQGQPRASFAAAPANGPGVDPDVDRLLDDGSQSPPYSPKEENDPDVVWRGNIIMNTIAEVQVAAKHMGGANLSETIGLAWDKLLPQSLTVCGRIDEQQAIVYLCGLRYSLPTDVVVVNLEPTTPAARSGMLKLIDYFISKKRYGVVGDKGVANVRDTYLVPVPPGSGNHPEFMLNLLDNFIPETRTEPMMLCVIVYRNDPETIQRIHGTAESNQPLRTHQAAAQGPGPSQSPGTPTPTQVTFPPVDRLSMSAPAFSPTSPQGAFPQYPSPRMGAPVRQPQPPPGPAPQAGRQNVDEMQRQGEAIAREVLGHLITSPTVSFLLPQAHIMSRREWDVIKKIYERDPRTRDDLPYLSNILEKEGQQQQQQLQQQQLQQQQQQHASQSPPPHPQHQSHLQHQPQQTQQPQQQHQQHQQHQHHQHPVRTTPIPPPPIPPSATAGPPRQTPIPPPPIPPQATASSGPPQA
ncbi:transcription factor S-II, central domain-containing protein [Chaetomidium leptoderma]|uniref:Transcription factor BYE1 n=1 Tax=Chaetomidium leptoderma TaxID=669021 RepID=A0AAN6VSF4_9PEZI|nr:transcription factor S-II, central domain-containing protein [Chaetomidium leptoderma]